MAQSDWTARDVGAEAHEGRWALGLEAMGFRVSRGLLPPLTNTTRRVRYYSFLAWAYWTFSEHMKRGGRTQATLVEQTAWRTRLEHAMRTATVLDPAYTYGLVGYNSAIRLTDGEPYPIGQDASITAWQAEYYKPSWLGLGLGSLRGNIVKLDPSRGVPIARAFDERVRSADPDGEYYHELVSTKNSVPAGLIRTLAPALALRPLSGEDRAERDLLISRLFHLVPDASPDAITRSDWTRSISLTLILDLVRAADGAFRNELTAHHVFATGRFPDGHGYTPPAVLANTYAKWQRYQEREQEKVALYALWHETLLAIRDAEPAPLPSSDIMRWVLDRIAASPFIQDYLGAEALNRTVSAALARLDTWAVGGGDAERLAQNATEDILDLSKMNKAGPAVLALLLLTRKWNAIQSDLASSVARIHTDAAPSELPVPWVARDIMEHRDLPLSRFVTHAVERWVLAQSLRVALEKWALKQDRFFIARDAEGYRIVRPQAPGGYLTYDPPRIDSSLQMMDDLGLVARAEVEVSLTTQGETLLADAIAFHEERLMGASAKVRTVREATTRDAP